MVHAELFFFQKHIQSPRLRAFCFISDTPLKQWKLLEKNKCVALYLHKDINWYRHSIVQAIHINVHTLNIHKKLGHMLQL